MDACGRVSGQCAGKGTLCPISSPWINPHEHRERRGAGLARRFEGGIAGLCARKATQSFSVQRGCIAARMPRGFCPRAASHGNTPGGHRSPSTPLEPVAFVPHGRPSCDTARSQRHQAQTQREERIWDGRAVTVRVRQGQASSFWASWKLHSLQLSDGWTGSRCPFPASSSPQPPSCATARRASRRGAGPPPSSSSGESPFSRGWCSCRSRPNCRTTSFATCGTAMCSWRA